VSEFNPSSVITFLLTFILHATVFHIPSLLPNSSGTQAEEANRLLKRRLETEKPRTDAAAEMSEDLFEGEKGEDAGDASVAYGDSSASNTPRISSIDKLYIVLIRYGLVSLTSCSIF
jgi:hypothetical protein